MTPNTIGTTNDLTHRAFTKPGMPIEMFELADEHIASDADWSENRPLSLLCFWQSLTFWRWVSGTAAATCIAMWLGAVYC